MNLLNLKDLNIPYVSIFDEYQSEEEVKGFTQKGWAVIDTQGKTLVFPMYQVSVLDVPVYFISPTNHETLSDFLTYYPDQTNDTFHTLDSISVLGNVKEYLQFKEKETTQLDNLYENQELLSDFLDYVIIDKNFSDSNYSGGSVSLELHTNACDHVDDLNGVTKDEYIKFIEYRVINEIEGDCDDFYFEFTPKGLTEALDKYHQLINSFSFDKIVS